MKARGWILLIGRRWLAVELSAGVVALALSLLAITGELAIWKASPTVMVGAAFLTGTGLAMAAKALLLPLALWRGG